MIIIFVLLMLLTFPNRDIDTNIAPYYNEYMTLVKAKCSEDQYLHPKNIFIEFRHLKSNYYGYCQNATNSFLIAINIDNWSDLSDEMRFQLISHELTHCMFKEPHHVEFYSYMYPTLRYHSRDETMSQINYLLDQKCGMVK